MVVRGNNKWYEEEGVAEVVKITGIWQTKNFLRPVAAVMAVAGLFCLSPATASAATYQDVENFCNPTHRGALCKG